LVSWICPECCGPTILEYSGRASACGCLGIDPDLSIDETWNTYKASRLYELEKWIATGRVRQKGEGYLVLLYTIAIEMFNHPSLTLLILSKPIFSYTFFFLTFSGKTRNNNAQQQTFASHGTCYWEETATSSSLSIPDKSETPLSTSVRKNNSVLHEYDKVGTQRRTSHLGKTEN
jgi:hypothetical protein